MPLAVEAQNPKHWTARVLLALRHFPKDFLLLRLFCTMLPNSQESCLFVRCLSGFPWGWCNGRGPHLQLRRDPQGSSPMKALSLLANQFHSAFFCWPAPAPKPQSPFSLHQNLTFSVALANTECRILGAHMSSVPWELHGLAPQL